MSRQNGLRIACALLFAVSHAGTIPLRAATLQAPPAAADAAKASPDLVGQLAKEIGGSPEQAAGAAGALFGIAKKRLQPDQFSKVEGAVPGMSSLLSAAPALDAAGGAVADDAKGKQKGAGGLAAKMGGLADAASAFSKLGLKPSMVAKAVPVLTKFVSKSGGADVGKLLAGVLK
jgi:hypothetical protein